MLQIKSFHFRRRSGLSLLDAVLSLLVVTVIIGLVAVFVQVKVSDQDAALRANAAALADEEISALRDMSFTALTDQTNGPWLSVLSNAGTWTIGQNTAGLDAVSSPCPPATTSKHCGNNVLNLASASMSNTTSGRLLLPAGTYDSATIEGRWYVVSDSPANWAVGYLIRSRDARNGYRFRVANASVDLDSTKSGVQNAVIEKLVNGTASVLLSPPGPITFNTNTWYNLKVIVGTSGSDATLSAYIDGTQVGSGAYTDTSSPWTTGPAALLGWGGVHAQVDDVMTTVGATVSSWSFQSSTDLPTEWTRLSPNDLPDGSPTVFDNNVTLTLAPYPNTNSANLKKADLTVSWTTGRGTSSYTTSSLIGKSGI